MGDRGGSEVSSCGMLFFFMSSANPSMGWLTTEGIPLRNHPVRSLKTQYDTQTLHVWNSYPRLPTTIILIGFTESTKDVTLQKPGQPFFKWSWKSRGLLPIHGVNEYTIYLLILWSVWDTTITHPNRSGLMIHDTIRPSQGARERGSLASIPIDAVFTSTAAPSVEPLLLLVPPHSVAAFGDSTSGLLRSPQGTMQGVSEAAFSFANFLGPILGLSE